MTPVPKLKIVLGVHQFFPDHGAGTEVLTLELARGLRLRGHDVRVMTAAPQIDQPLTMDPRFVLDNYDGFPVHRLHYGLGGWQNLIMVERKAPVRVRLVRDLLASLNPDIVHFNHIMGFTPDAIPAAKKLGFPVLFTPTDFWTICPRYTLFKPGQRQVCNGQTDPAQCLLCFRPMPPSAARILLTLCGGPFGPLIPRGPGLSLLRGWTREMMASVNQADAMLPSTRFLARMLIGYGMEETKVRVTPYGVDVGELPEALPLPHRFTEETPLEIGFIGTLSETKGPHVIMEALHHLGEERRNLRCSVYGRMDDSSAYCNNLKELARPLGEHVRFRGTFPHEEIGARLRGFHLLVVPSIWYESAPLVLVSGLNAGTPLVVSDLGGLTEMISEPRYGRSFTPGDGASLARVLKEFLDSPDTIRAMRENMRGLGRTTDDYVEDMETLYFRLHS